MPKSDFPREFQKELPVVIDNVMRVELSLQLAARTVELQAFDDAWKDEKNQHRRDRERREGEIAAIAQKVNDSCELQAVTCVETVDEETWTLRTHRQDTGEEISRRTLSSDEREAYQQADLPLDDEPPERPRDEEIDIDDLVNKLQLDEYARSFDPPLEYESAKTIAKTRENIRHARDARRKLEAIGGGQ